MSSKPIIFLSHIAEEAELVKAFKETIESSFLGMVDLFVSSDKTTIGLGVNWLDRITDGLRNAHAMIIFCSPISVSRPWINFEAGAGWARKIEVAPLCHSGLRPVELPLPLNLLQGIEANDPLKLEQMFALVAQKVGCSVPKVDLAPLAERVRDFEHMYVIQVSANSPLRSIAKLWPELSTALRQTNIIAAAGVEEWKVDLVRPALLDLQENKLIRFSYNRTNVTIGGDGSGDFGELKIAVAPALRELLEKVA